MRRKGAAVRRKHNVGVAVVGGDNHRASKLFHLRRNFSEALVHRFAGCHSGGKNAGVPYHIRVGIVQNNHVILAAVKLLK